MKRKETAIRMDIRWSDFALHTCRDINVLFYLSFCLFSLFPRVHDLVRIALFYAALSALSVPIQNCK